MKYDFQITLVPAYDCDFQNIIFKSSRTQADRVFNALCFALCYSPYDKIILFQGEFPVSSCEISNPIKMR